MDCIYKGGLKNASNLPVTTISIVIPTISVFKVNIICPKASHQSIQPSESLCPHHYWMTAFSYHWRPLAAFCLPHSHPGPHWSADGRPPCLLPSSGSQWWRLPWGPPADLHSGSHSRRPQGCPALWTWCRRRWNPGLWHEVASWLGWTTQTAAPRAAACPRRHRYGVLTHVPSIRPGHAGGYLIMEKRGGSSGGKEGWQCERGEFRGESE